MTGTYWTFARDLGVFSTAGGVLLWLLDVVAAVLACAYLWELCDALGTEHGRRVAGRDRRVLRLAVNGAGGRPRLRAGPVRPPGRVSPHAQDQRVRQLVAGVSSQLAGDVVGSAGCTGHRRLTHQAGHLRRS